MSTVSDIEDVSIRRPIERTLEQFRLDESTIKEGVRYFIKQMEDGLENNSESHDFMPMIPSFITYIPNGSETGLSLAADLGGTNFRICSVELNGDHSFNLEQYKTKVDKGLMVGSSKELFEFLVRQIKYFLKQHHSDYMNEKKENIKMSFTFSFPLDQTALNKGTLIRWTKGFDIEDAVNQDIVELFQAAIDKEKLPVDIVAITNDTVGTLLANAYASVSGHKTVLGAIFGTGTNGAYAEKLDNIIKLNPEYKNKLKSKGINYMVINTEWGSFDNKLEFLPTTIYDEIVDSETSNPGIHVFEKRISGMFLGELVRLVILDLHKRKLILTSYEQLETTLKSISSSASLVNLTNLPRRPGNKKLSHRVLTEWNLQTENLSKIQIDDTKDLKVTDLVLQESLHLITTLQDRIIIKAIANAVANRAALLSSIAVAAIVLKTGRLGVTVNSTTGDLEKTEFSDDVVEVGVDGAVVEFYPGFRENMVKGLELSQLGEKFAKKIELTIAKDGSGVGAALCTNSAIDF